MSERTYTVFHLFCGIGGGALGFQRAVATYAGETARYRTLGGVDVDPAACADYAALTGHAATPMDLFTRADYTAWHGHAPPDGWQEVTPAELRAVTHGERPDVVFLSPPCVGHSALLPAATANTPKYAAMNRLALRGVWLVLEAWKDAPPGLLLLENVPRITARGAVWLAAIRELLTAYGYMLHEGGHDLGVVGGLAQHRRRYLLVARHGATVPAVLYQPSAKRVRPVSAVLDALPMPDAVAGGAGGAMHRLPRLQWRTWVRLALIPAGGDWRDLQGVAPGTYAVTPAGWFENAYGVGAWSDPAATVTGGNAPSCGRLSVADPRLGHTPRGGVYRVQRWDRPATTVVGAASVRGSNGVAAVADPRLGCAPRSGAYGVIAWDRPAPAVTGAGDVHSQGAAAVADPRLPGDTQAGAWVIVAEDGAWHRPLTTWELAALQGLPLYDAAGAPLVLAGASHTEWRKRIGNAVPPSAAEAVATAMLVTLIAADRNLLVWNAFAAAVWVRGRHLRLLSRARPATETERRQS